MTIFILLPLLLITFFVWNNAKQKKLQKQKLHRIIEDWNNCTTTNKDTIDFNILQCDYQRMNHGCDGIDELTWNDLEMDQIFQQMNFTSSIAGENYLYELLHKPQFDESELIERNRVITVFSENEELRIKLQSQIAKVGSTCSKSMYEYLLDCKDLTAPKKWPHILVACFLLLSILLIIFYRKLGLITFILVLGTSVFLYYKDKIAIERDLPSIRIIGNLLIAANELSHLEDSSLSAYFAHLKSSRSLFKQFKRTIRSICSGVNVLTSDLDIVSDYLRIVSHIDIILYHSYLKKLKASYHELILIYQMIGFLDSMIAIAKYRKTYPETCRPVFSNSLSLIAQDLYHPLIPDAVPNDFYSKKNTLITGSNASGKSTFLRTLGINALLAQTIDTVHAKQFTTNFYHIHTSISLKDDLENKESYYMVELNALKKIFDSALQGYPVLCLIDEVLKGTNTLERIAASTEVLKDLLQYKTLCIAATHDVELTKLLQNEYQNMYFRESIKDEELHFDYKIKPGVCTSGNAIKLLELMGFPKNIPSHANERIQYFKKYGSWY